MNQLLPIRDRLRRANEHIEEIRGMLRNYYRDQPSDIAGEFDPNIPAVRYNFKEPYGPPPARLATIAGEVFHNLRSSLDHLAWELVEEHKPGSATKYTSFPIWDIPPAPDKQGVTHPPRISGGVSPTALAMIERVQPYRFGPVFAGDSLYVLRELNNIDKHRHVTIRGVRSEGSLLAGTPRRFVFSTRLKGVTEYGAELEFLSNDPTVDVHFSTTFQVVVQEIGPGIIMPLIDALTRTREAVEEIVNEAQRTCFPPKQAPFPD